VPDEDRNVFRRRDVILKPRDFEIEVPMIELLDHGLFDNPLEHTDVEDISSLRIDFPFHDYVQIVVVSVEVWVIAGPERIPVPLVRLGGIVQPMCGIEMQATSNEAAGHGQFSVGEDEGAATQ
jgi:hypothetical protein